MKKKIKYTEAEWKKKDEENIKKFFTKEKAADIIALMKENNLCEIELKKQFFEFWKGDKEYGEKVFRWFEIRMNYKK